MKVLCSYQLTLGIPAPAHQNGFSLNARVEQASGNGMIPENAMNGVNFLLTSHSDI